MSRLRTSPPAYPSGGGAVGTGDDRVVGAEGVPALTYAPLWRRAVAAVADAVVLLLLGWPVAVGMGSTTGTGYELSGPPALLVVVLWLAYYAGTEAGWGATLGKRLMGIRVVAEDGSPVDLGAAVVRNVLRVVDALLFYLVGSLVALASPRRQRLGDQLARTAVVRTRAPARSGSQEATLV